MGGAFMSVSKDVRVKEYNGARSASSALKIEKVETQANIKVHESIASAGTEQLQPTSVGPMNENVVDLKMDGKALNDFGVELTSGPEPVDTSQTSQKPTQDAPLKALQAEASGPSYKLLIGIAAGLVVVIAGLTIWSGGLGREEGAAAVSASNGAEAEASVAMAAQVVEPTTPANTVDENDFVAQMTAGTIAALRTSSTAATPADTVGEAKLAAATLFSMVLDATAKDLSQPEIDHMLNMAYENGTIKVPEPFLLSSGRVNTNAIMTTFVGQ